MKLLRYFCFVVAFVVLTVVYAGAQADTPQSAPTPSTPQFNPAQITKASVRALPVKDFKLLSSGTGWVSTGNQLLFTTDNGAHWKDISPPNPDQVGFDSVVFLDEKTAWVLSYVANTDDDADFVISSTVNGGTTWDTTKIKIPLGDPAHGAPELAGGGSIAFADKLHGWLLFRYQTGGAFNSAGLFATTDGGHTWHESKDNPGFAGEIRAFPNGDVWVSGHPGVNEEGKIEELVVNHQGINGFEDVSLPNLKEFGPEQEPTYSLPVFESKFHGYEAVTYLDSDGTKSIAVLFETEDGGRTWKADRKLSNPALSETVKTTVAGSTWILPFAPQGSRPTLIKLNPNDKIAASDHKGNGDFRRCELSFITRDEGWMNCSVP